MGKDRSTNYFTDSIKAQQARMEAAEARKKDIGQKVRHIFLTEDQINSVLDRLELNEKQPETLRLLVRKLATKVTVSRETIKVRLVLALDVSLVQNRCRPKALLIIYFLYQSSGIKLFSFHQSSITELRKLSFLRLA